MYRINFSRGYYLTITDRPNYPDRSIYALRREQPGRDTRPEYFAWYPNLDSALMACHSAIISDAFADYPGITLKEWTALAEQLNSEFRQQLADLGLDYDAVLSGQLA